MATLAMHSLSAVGSLVLTRLLPVSEKGEPSSKIKKDLEPLLAHRWTSEILTERIEQALGDLKSLGLIVLMAGRTKKAAAKFMLTVEGRRQALKFLGITHLKPKITWAVLKKIYLPACVLRLPVATEAQFKALSSEPAFQAVLLKRQYNLAIAEMPKPDEAIDALAWALIGFEGESRKFNSKNVKTELFNRALGDARTVNFKKAITRLLAQRIGARRDDPKELREAVLRGWIDQEENGPTTAGSARPFLTSPPSSSTALPSFDLASFAEQVKLAARDCPTGRFGDNKVFITHVWKSLQADPTFATMGLAAFKERLTEANNARLLDLSRADLVQAMDPNDVCQSEVHYLNATFHFVRI